LWLNFHWFNYKILKILSEKVQTCIHWWLVAFKMPTEQTLKWSEKFGVINKLIPHPQWVKLRVMGDNLMGFICTEKEQNMYQIFHFTKKCNFFQRKNNIICRTILKWNFLNNDQLTKSPTSHKTEEYGWFIYHLKANFLHYF
jgi:hypothetical protein